MLPFPCPGDLPDPGIEPQSPELAGEFFLPLSHQGSLKKEYLLSKLMQTQDLLWGVGIDCAFSSAVAAYIYI